MAQVTSTTVTEASASDVYFISDAHLGSGSDSLDRERQLCRLLDSLFLQPPKASGNHATRQPKLILLGDIFDFWFTYRHLVPRGHTRLLGKLAELADNGVEIHFFTGNHDMWMFDYLTKEIGAVLHEEPTVMDLCGKRLLVGHGDGLGHTDRWFDFVRFFFRSRFCHRLFKMLPSALTFGIAHRWSDSNKRKHARHNLLHYLGDDREGIVIYLKQRLQKEHFDYCVFGHRHTPLVKKLTCTIGQSSNQAVTTYVNTGDWFHNRNYAVLHPDGTLQLLDYKIDN